MARKKTRMQGPQTTREVVADHRKAAREVLKKVTRSRAAARKYLIDLGVIDKRGGLTKHYRP
jgi:hypothetical protein